MILGCNLLEFVAVECLASSPCVVFQMLMSFFVLPESTEPYTNRRVDVRVYGIRKYLALAGVITFGVLSANMCRMGGLGLHVPKNLLS